MVAEDVLVSAASHAASATAQSDIAENDNISSTEM